MSHMDSMETYKTIKVGYNGLFSCQSFYFFLFFIQYHLVLVSFRIFTIIFSSLLNHAISFEWKHFLIEYVRHYSTANLKPNPFSRR
jgi:hypothetical protein